MAAFSIPGSNITHRHFDLQSEVRKADPNWDRESRRSPEYEFSARRFWRINKNFAQYAEEEGGNPAGGGDQRPDWL